jgi:signal transduction histidine kinase/CheY-like chemotaxis protein
VAVRAKGAEMLGSNQLWRDRPPQPHWQLSYTPLTGAWEGLELITAQEPSLDRLKTEFLACIDHELKSPLTSVIGIANLLNQQTLGELNQKQSRYVQMIHQSGRHLMETINSIIDLAQAEAGQLELELETIDLPSVCQGSIRQTLRWVEQTAWLNCQPVPQTMIELDLPADLCTCTADPARLQQMLVNLLTNACKFSHEAVPTSITLQVRQWGRWLAFTVIDQGIGIPEAQQHLIFQKFQQVDSSLSRRYEGTGLGLVLTRQLARLHGGDVSFLSQEGVGSQFTILLPYHSEQCDPRPNNLVLIGETRTSDIDHLITLLRCANYHAVIARNGIEAMEKIRLLHPSASIISADLPLMSGWDIYHTLRREQPSYMHNLAVAIRAGQSDHGIPEAVLVKPIALDALNLFLARLVQMHRIPVLIYIRQYLAESCMHSLQGLGYRLIEAEDSEQAQVLWRIWQPDLLVTTTPIPNHKLQNLPWVLVNADDPQEVLAKVVSDAITAGTVWGTALPQR